MDRPDTICVQRSTRKRLLQLKLDSQAKNVDAVIIGLLNHDPLLLELLKNPKSKEYAKKANSILNRMLEAKS